MMLGLKTLTITYEGNLSPALSNFSLNVQKSDVVVIVGESGCGKTTLLKCIAGFEKPDSGSIVLSDQVMFSNREFVPPQKRKVGMMFQNYALLPHFSVKKNILYGINHLSIFLQHRRLIKLVNLFKIRGLLRKYPHQLSGGEQQRVSLARSLATSPKLLLLDEPFSSLDKSNRDQLVKQVREILKNAGVTSILVTHDETEAEVFADKVGIINKKQLLIK